MITVFFFFPFLNGSQFSFSFSFFFFLCCGEVASNTHFFGGFSTIATYHFSSATSSLLPVQFFFFFACFSSAFVTLITIFY